MNYRIIYVNQILHTLLSTFEKNHPLCINDFYYFIASILEDLSNDEICFFVNSLPEEIFDQCSEKEIYKLLTTWRQQYIYDNPESYTIYCFQSDDSDDYSTESSDSSDSNDSSDYYSTGSDSDDDDYINEDDIEIYRSSSCLF